MRVNDPFYIAVSYDYKNPMERFTDVLVKAVSFGHKVWLPFSFYFLYGSFFNLKNFLIPSNLRLCVAKQDGVLGDLELSPSLKGLTATAALMERWKWMLQRPCRCAMLPGWLRAPWTRSSLNFCFAQRCFQFGVLVSNLGCYIYRQRITQPTAALILQT